MRSAWTPACWREITASRFSIGPRASPIPRRTQVRSHFRGGGRLPLPPQTHQQDHPRRLASQAETPGLTQGRDQRPVQDLDPLLGGVQRSSDLLPRRRLSYPIEKVLRDLRVDVGFEQRQADLA